MFNDCLVKDKACIISFLSLSFGTLSVLQKTGPSGVLSSFLCPPIGMQDAGGDGAAWRGSLIVRTGTIKEERIGTK